MNQTPPVGQNLTGVSTNASCAEAMLSGMELFPPSSAGTTAGAGKIRVQYAEEGFSQGSIPKPAETKEKIKTALGMGVPPSLMDKLGERLAFERTGTRLYEALVSKFEAYGGFAGGPKREDLLEILNEEHEHFFMLSERIAQFGGDPTAVTPSANVAAVASEGVMKVITDPRTTFLQSLEAILIAELTDRDSWELLCDASRDAGLTELQAQCEAAEATEERHLSKVRSWLKAGMKLPKSEE
jgi:rubrerythrin